MRKARYSADCKWTYNPVYQHMLKEYYADPTLTFDERPKLSRTNQHPLVKGYVTAFLRDWPFHTIHDIAEYIYAQMIRDCGAFLWRYRDSIEVCTWFNEDQVLETMGEMLWLSRQDDAGGFDSSSFELAGLYHDYAKLHLGSLVPMERDGELIFYHLEYAEHYEKSTTVEVPDDFEFDLTYDGEDPFGFESIEAGFRFDI